MQEGVHEGESESMALGKGREVRGGEGRGGEEGELPQALHQRLFEAKAQPPGLVHCFAASSGRT